MGPVENIDAGQLPSTHRMRRRVLALALGSIWMLPLGCPTDDADDDSQENFSPCEFEDRSEAYEAGMVHPGTEGLLDVALLGVTPSPPDVGDSEWLVEVTEPGGGAPISDCSIIATGWMPDHGHGGPEGASTPAAETGQYTVSGLSFVMSGYWEITLAVDCLGLEQDQVVFRFCLPG